MRDPNRIDPMLELIREVWKAHPDLRLGQLIINLSDTSNGKPELFYLEDDEFARRILRR